MITSPLRRGRTFSRTVIGALLLVFAIDAYTQNGGLNTSLQLDFLKSEEIVSVDNVVTNVARAVNRTSRPIRFNLDLAYPGGWRVVNDLTKLYTVAPGDSTFIPIRLVPSKTTSGNVNYFISATAYSEFGDALASSPWSVQVKKITKWNLLVEEKHVYFTNESDSATLHVRMLNEGNSVEQIRVSFIPDSRLKVLDHEWKTIQDNSMLMELPVGIDTTFEINVKVSQNKTKGYFFTDTPDDDQEKVDKQKFRLQISGVSTEERSRAKGRRVNFTKLTNTARFKSENGSSVIPLTVELNSYNILSNFTNFSLDLRGASDLGGQRYLNYYYQAIVTSSLAGGTQVRSANRLLQYSTPDYLVAVGGVGENMGLFINGIGAKAKYKYKRFEVGAIYANNANRGGPLSRNDLTYYAGHLRYELKKGSDAEVQYVNQVDKPNSIDGSLIRVRANHKFAKKHRLSVIAAYSLQKDSFNPDSLFQTKGYGGEFRYYGMVDKITYGVTGTYYSDSFLAQRSGTKGVSANARYPLKGGASLSFRGNIVSSRPVRFLRGNRFESQLNKRNRYEFRYEWRNNGATMNIIPSYRDEEVLGLKVKTPGISAAYSKNNGRSFRVFTRFYAGYSSLPDFDQVAPFPVARWENRVRYKNINVVARYNYGPSSITENFRVINDNINPQSIFLSAYATLYFRKQGFLIRPRFNSRYESVFARWRSNISGEFSYYAKSGYTYTIGTEIVNINQGESPLSFQNDNTLQPFKESNFFLRFSIKKEFGFRRPGGKTFDLNVVFYKDADGNGKRDKGEEYVENVLVKVGEESALTDNNGLTTFENLEQGEYLIESTLLGDTQGWFKVNDESILVSKNQTVYIPLTRGVQITGRVIVQKANFSRAFGEVKIGGIRISAIGSDGKSYSGLTDRSGQFRVFVPFGQYTIDASSSTVDEQFQFAQDSYKLSIDNADSNYELTFYLIEKTRRLNIRKFDNNK